MVVRASAVQQDENGPLAKSGGVKGTVIGGVVDERLHRLATPTDRCVLQCVGPSAREFEIWAPALHGTGQLARQVCLSRLL